MFRNQYDSDVTVWSPQGRLHQVEYAMEAVKLGSATVGLKNRQFAVLIALKRAVSELSAYQKKIIPIDGHIGISISGLTADARMLSRFMRTECLNHQYSHDAPMPVGRLIGLVGNKMQICTQRYDKRPLGVGLLVAGYDDQGPHIYQTCPSANYFDCRAMAIGARSQSARTYLEKHLNSFLDCDVQELVAHGLRALRDTLPNEVDLNTKNVSIAIVGPNTPLRICDEEELTRFLALVEGEERRGGQVAATGDAGGSSGQERDSGDDRDPQVGFEFNVAMYRLLTAILLLGVTTSAFNLEYLDPTKLQTYISAETQRRAALSIIGRYIHHNQNIVIVEVDPKLFTNNKDSFSLNVRENKLYIRASSGVAAVWGFNYYLKKYCKSQIEWQTKNVYIPDYFPVVNETVVANDRFRYYQNVCTVSYSFVWWNYADWLKHLDWMALNGINLVLAPVAQEAVWSKIYQNIGMTQEEIDQYTTGPTFLSWLRMGNVHGWGGPLPKSWHDLQRTIQTEIIPLMLDLGMVPVLPAFNGHVPRAFSRIYPKNVFRNVSQWNSFDDEYCCDLFVDPNDPLFKNIGKMFLNEIRTPGVHIYTADSFNEVIVTEFSTKFVQDTAKAIFTTLEEFDRDAVWLIQNWMFVSAPLMWPLSRVEAFVTSVPLGRMLFLDLQSEQWPQYDLYKMYYGQPFIWCMLHNFGGTLGMFGNMVTINKDVYEVRSRVNSTMIGIGLTPEGINQNYVVYDLMLESAWRKSPVKDMEAWITDYAERRHGCRETGEAWKYLLKSVYSFHGLNRVRGKYVVTRRPSFKIQPWAWYTSYDLFQAFRQMIYVNDSNCNTEGYRYDLVDVTRQALQYRAEQLYLNVVEDRYTNTFVFESSINRFLSALQDMTSILLDSEYFHAEKWFRMARNIGRNEDEKYYYEMNARNQITLWGPKGEISDYACKQWAELMRDYYTPRWNMFLSAALASKKAEEVFNDRAVRRVVTANVEIPYATMSFERGIGDKNYYQPSWESTKELAKSLYRKWAHIADVNDLPLAIIKRESVPVTSNADVSVESSETPEGPTVLMYTTPTD